MAEKTFNRAISTPRTGPLLPGDTRKPAAARSGWGPASFEIGARPPFDCIALLLQGGGALGAYQAGVYHALAEINVHPNWVAGISIGAINSALIAGNPAEQRVEKLRQFWQSVTADPNTNALYR